ncbi:6TM ABC transporter family protein [Rhodopirellula islandica]|uniref:hypothetical protein n=1 Tax=Rhodopirellula islandica TaxID=595434 RepID=UPI000649DE77|nr:hypothetical protein [Rhodopirellula islandica]
MPRNPKTPAKDFFTGVAWLAGFGLLVLLLWFVALLVIAALIFFGLTAFTNWNLGARIGFSLISAFITMKVLGFISATLDLIPEAWIEGKKKTKPCPECGKNLRAVLAQQCMHCGADWHS